MANILDRLKTALADRYAIEREVGSGGMATVYLAEDLKHHRKVAVKVLRPELAAIVGTERFLREIEIAASLTHPHILPLFDSGEADGLLYYVMPYVEGETLRDRLNREKQLPIEDAVKVTSDIAAALGHAHAHHVVHRDIKPENILLEAGLAVVADFGIARAVHTAGGTRLTETGIAVGTPTYMSPEQATGTEDLDGRSDIYSLGCVLYEMLAGEPPFTGPTAQSLVQQHITVEAPSVTVVRNHVSVEVAQAIAQALAKTPADRFSTGGAFARALATTPTSTSVAATPQSHKRNRLSVVAIAAVVLTFVLGAVFWPSGGTATVSDRVFVAPLENNTGDSSLNALGGLIAGSLTQTIHQTGVAHVIPSSVAAQSLMDLEREGRAGSGSALEAARLNEARFLLTGKVHPAGDGLQLLIEIIDIETGALLRALPPSSFPIDSLDTGLRPLTADVLGALASLLDVRLNQETSLEFNTPDLTAYTAFADGFELAMTGRSREALPFFQRAIAADSTFWQAYLWLSFYTPDRAIEDLLLGIVEQHADELSEYDRLTLRTSQAAVAGDREGELRARRGRFELAPGSDRDATEYGRMLGYVGRFEEARRVLESIDVNGGWWVRQRPNVTWWLTDVLHVLGEYRAESRVAREAADRHPDNDGLEWRVGRASIATENTRDLERIVGEIAQGANPTRLMQLAWELHRHGYDGKAEQVHQQIVDWYQDSPTRTESIGQRCQGPGSVTPTTYGAALFFAGDVEGAIPILWGCVNSDEHNPARLGMLGLALAASGDAAGAAAIQGRLEDVKDQYKQRGWASRDVTWHQMFIAAAHDPTGAGIQLLRSYLDEGGLYGRWLHTDPRLDPLRDHPDFNAMARLSL